MGGASAPTLSAPIAGTLIATGSKGIGAEAPPTKTAPAARGRRCGGEGRRREAAAAVERATRVRR
ncbi:DUF6053 domain-containing protein [Lysobacter yananisis]|uniref:DUF6053 domain-containing protein n=1 Tax=Lysobacter yananisis TaxID=1003114 RepID=UPI003CE58078